MLPSVEWITQAALGAAIGEAMLGKKLGNRAMIWGIAIAWLPHLDFLLGAFFPTWLDLYIVDGLGHSVIVAALVAFYGGRRLSLLWKKQKVTPGEASGFVFAVWASFVLREALTVDGTWLLWPVSYGRLSFPIIPQIDLLLTLPLVFSLIKLSLLRTKKEQPIRRRWLVRGVAITAGVLIMGLLLRGWTHAAFTSDLTRRGVAIEREMDAPASWNRLLWRATIKSGDDLWVGYRSIFEMPGTPVQWTVYPIQSDAVEPWSKEKEVKAALWKADGWSIARSNKKGIWIADLGHAEARAWGTKKPTLDTRPAAAWLLDVTRPSNRLREIQGHTDPVDQFQRMCWRIVGKREEWNNDSPRLASVPGSLPEVLMVQE